MGAPCPECFDFVSRWLNYRYSGDLGVQMFFVLSGFLVFASYDRSCNLVTFAKARALRIFPGLVVCVLLMVFVVGPSMTTISMHDYFSSDRTREYFFSNASLYRAIADLPGVFLSNAVPNIVNGPLWTLPIESRFYLFVALIGSIGLSATRWSANATVSAMCLMALFLPDFLPMVGTDPSYHRLGAFFAAGVLLYVNRNSVPLNAGIAVMLVLCAVFSFGSSTFDFAAGLVIVYGVFWLGFTKKLRLPRFIQDYSYGIYLYGWPVAQTITHLRPQMGGYWLVAATLAASWVVGATSWFFVEKPCLALKKKAGHQRLSTSDVAGAM